MKPIYIIVGGQYGSEGKGAIAALYSERYGLNIVIRTGAINAGHTVPFRGQMYKMQQLPTAWVNPNALLVLGPGAYIHIETLEREVEMINKLMGGDVRDRVLIDRRCGLHHQGHEDQAKGANRHLTMGATGKGCAEAIIDKIKNRTDGCYLFADTDASKKYRLIDVPDYVTDAYHGGAGILIEGTQGAELDLHQGPYPYVTSRMTSAANWVAEAGLSPSLRYLVVLVARTYPIRVAGNSGPLPNETSWPHMLRMWNARLEQLGRGVLFSNDVVTAFEKCVRQVASDFELPMYSDGLDQHGWGTVARVKFKRALSELYPTALGLMEEKYPLSYAQISPYIERTTVTNKPRRIGAMDPHQLARVIRREAPDHVILTFFNYLYPETWGQVSINPEHHRHITRLALPLGARIAAVTTGPMPDHFVHV